MNSCRNRANRSPTSPRPSQHEEQKVQQRMEPPALHDGVQLAQGLQRLELGSPLRSGLGSRQAEPHHGHAPVHLYRGGDDDEHLPQGYRFAAAPALALPWAAAPQAAEVAIRVRSLPRTTPPGEAQHQNMPVATEPGVLQLCPSLEPSCGASCDRASICACLACNTPACPPAIGPAARVPRQAAARTRDAASRPRKPTVVGSLLRLPVQ